MALCVGGVNRLTGQLVEGFWGSSCDADEREMGGFFDKAVLPTALIAKAHMPDLARVVPAFNVESIEGTEAVQQRFSRKVEFESLDFNKRFWTTVPKDFDPIKLRELFGPGFLAWVTTMSGKVDFGVNDRQLWFNWHLKERSEEELKLALKNAGQLFKRLQSEMDESGIHTYPPGPVARRPGAVPRRARGRFLAARPELALGELDVLAEHPQRFRLADPGDDEAGLLALAFEHRHQRLGRVAAVGGERGRRRSGARRASRAGCGSGRRTPSRRAPRRRAPRRARTSGPR